ncbi:hypothetical protein CLIM01_14834 [Colletotrichum limetticola]|uniref:Uncharacterized protein n=1 Tax=Colletotrichum limetticola TaxID=1209924 RepID=A0ABQ9P6P8_9PEZI|nr:hypothetical protein CLIM01_14834 [Colletotrichum limetticola]
MTKADQQAAQEALESGNVRSSRTRSGAIADQEAVDSRSGSMRKGKAAASRRRSPPKLRAQSTWVADLSTEQTAEIDAAINHGIAMTMTEGADKAIANACISIALHEPIVQRRKKDRITFFGLLQELVTRYTVTSPSDAHSAEDVIKVFTKSLATPFENEKAAKESMMRLAVQVVRNIKGQRNLGVAEYIDAQFKRRDGVSQQQATAIELEGQPSTQQQVQPPAQSQPALPPVQVQPPALPPVEPPTEPPVHKADSTEDVADLLQRKLHPESVRQGGGTSHFGSITATTQTPQPLTAQGNVTRQESIKYAVSSEKKALPFSNKKRADVHRTPTESSPDRDDGGDAIMHDPRKVKETKQRKSVIQIPTYDHQTDVEMGFPKPPSSDGRQPPTKALRPEQDPTANELDNMSLGSLQELLAGVQRRIHDLNPALGRKPNLLQDHGAYEDTDEVSSEGRQCACELNQCHCSDEDVKRENHFYEKRSIKRERSEHDKGSYGFQDGHWSFEAPDPEKHGEYSWARVEGKPRVKGLTMVSFAANPLGEGRPRRYYAFKDCDVPLDQSVLPRLKMGTRQQIEKYPGMVLPIGAGYTLNYAGEVQKNSIRWACFKEDFTSVGPNANLGDARTRLSQETWFTFTDCRYRYKGGTWGVFRGVWARAGQSDPREPRSKRTREKLQHVGGRLRDRAPLWLWDEAHSSKMPVLGRELSVSPPASPRTARGSGRLRQRDHEGQKEYRYYSPAKPRKPSLPVRRKSNLGQRPSIPGRPDRRRRIYDEDDESEGLVSEFNSAAGSDDASTSEYMTDYPSDDGSDSVVTYEDRSPRSTPRSALQREKSRHASHMERDSSSSPGLLIQDGPRIIQEARKMDARPGARIAITGIRQRLNEKAEIPAARQKFGVTAMLQGLEETEGVDHTGLNILAGVRMIEDE